jgi:hypothetical protein
VKINIVNDLRSVLMETVALDRLTLLDLNGNR